MSTPPPRLRDTDPRFAKIAASLEQRGPDPALVAKVLAIPDGSPAAPSRGATSVRSASIGRWVVAGACALTLAALGWTLAEPTTAAPHAPSTPLPRQVAPLESPSTPASAPPPDNAVAPTVSVDDLPAAPEKLGRASASVAAPVKQVADAPASPASSFHEELALVEAARSALARGDARASLEMLDRYDERFRHGALAAEAEVTRIEALAKSGRTEEARTLADRFLERRATSSYVARVRAIRGKLGEGEEGKGR